MLNNVGIFHQPAIFRAEVGLATPHSCPLTTHCLMYSTQPRTHTTSTTSLVCLRYRTPKQAPVRLVRYTYSVCGDISPETNPVAKHPYLSAHAQHPIDTKVLPGLSSALKVEPHKATGGAARGPQGLELASADNSAVTPTTHSSQPRKWVCHRPPTISFSEHIHY